MKVEQFQEIVSVLSKFGVEHHFVFADKKECDELQKDYKDKFDEGGSANIEDGWRKSDEELKNDYGIRCHGAFISCGVNVYFVETIDE